MVSEDYTLVILLFVYLYIGILGKNNLTNTQIYYLPYSSHLTYLPIVKEYRGKY